MHQIETVVVWLAAVCTAAALCVGAASPLVAVHAQAGRKVPDPCSLLTADQIRKLTGRSDAARFRPTPEEMSNGDKACVFDGGGEGARQIEVRVSPGWSRARFDAYNKGKQSVSGIGEAAYFKAAPGKGEGAGLFVLVGEYLLAVGMQSDTESGDALRPSITELAKAAAAKIG